jgi:hypothetical protein
MRQLLAVSLLASLMPSASACGDDTGATGAGGDASSTSADGGSSSGSDGGGGAAAEDRCPEVCAKLESLFESLGCEVEECNCKPACADVFEASIDCLAPDSDACTCSGNELDCGSLCQEENVAANDCYEAN